MQLDLDLHDRLVVVVGAHSAARRVVKRFTVAGARVTAVVDGSIPPPVEQAPGVRYVVRPETGQLPDWINLVGPSWLVVVVGQDAATTERIRSVGDHLRIPVVFEPAASTAGMVTLVGGGPGSGGLLTVAACEALREADVVFYDRLAPTDHLRELAPAAELIDVGKRPHHHVVPQDQIEQRLVARAQLGDSVVRLKGGDPFVFGRGGEEVLACVAAGVAVRVVPGVSSALAVPAAVGIPLTHRGVSRAFTVVSGHDPLSSEQLSALVGLDSTLVILMGINNLPQITAGLLRAGLASDTPAAVIERGYSSTQRTTVTTVDRLGDEVRRLDVRPPAVVVIGAVVRLAAESRGGAEWLGLQSLAAGALGAS